MRSHCALYVDAGYLLAAAATRVTGTSLRTGVDIDHPRLIGSMIEQAEDMSGLPLLRVNWYDSGAKPGGVPDWTQEQIGLLPRVKLRLGRLGYSGEQKGVDVKIGLDIVAHARNDAVDLMYLVSGDDDLTEAVEEAQGHGVQVIVLAVPGADGAPHGVSRHLQREADGIEIMRMAAVDAAVTPAVKVLRPMPSPIPTSDVATSGLPTPAVFAGTKRPAAATSNPAGPVPTPPPSHTHQPVQTSGLVYTSSTGQPSVVLGADEELSDDTNAKIDEVCSSVLATWSKNATPEWLAKLHRGGTGIPADIDRALLLDLSSRLNIYDLSDPIRFELRRRFWLHVSDNPDVKAAVNDTP